MSNNKVFIVADIHRLLKEVWGEKISYSRMIEIMNEMAKEHYSNAENLPISDVSEWVAVSERLPEDDINVLCYHNSGNYFICYRTKDCNTNEPKWFGGAMPDFWKPLEPPCR